jgi:hypothetical protein
MNIHKLNPVDGNNFGKLLNNKSGKQIDKQKKSIHVIQVLYRLVLLVEIQYSPISYIKNIGQKGL